MQVKFTVSSVYPCDSDSFIKQISCSRVLDTKVTCNGVNVVGPADDDYDVIFNNPNKWGNGNWVTKQKIKLTNYTEVITYNNGNFISDKIEHYVHVNFNQGFANYLECGIIVGGPCNGDTLWGMRKTRSYKYRFPFASISSDIIIKQNEFNNNLDHSFHSYFGR